MVILGRGYSQYGIEELDFDRGSETRHLLQLHRAIDRGGRGYGNRVFQMTDMLIAHDCGIPLNPINVEAQNQGAAMQGMGQAMYEEFKMDHGKTLNPTLSDYKMPLASDIPDIKLWTSSPRIRMGLSAPRRPRKGPSSACRHPSSRRFTMPRASGSRSSP